MFSQGIEIRWFLKEEPSNLIRKIFPNSAAPATRTDWYAIPCNPGCGIKTREGFLETKLRLVELGPEKFKHIDGRVEEWAKWRAKYEDDDMPPNGFLQSNGWIAVEKNRYLEMFHLEGEGVQKLDFKNIPEWWKKEGCQFECTELLIKGENWWTIGFEAFGSPLLIHQNLRNVVEYVLEVGDQVPGLKLVNSYGYPAFLNLIYDEA